MCYIGDDFGELWFDFRERVSDYGCMPEGEHGVWLASDSSFEYFRIIEYYNFYVLLKSDR